LVEAERSEEVLRMLAALETGGMCPEDWSVGGSTLDPTKTLKPGSILAHYRIERKVGSGTFASVFRAHDTTLDRTVALKVFNPGSLATPLAALAEARSAAALNHPNVCTVYAADDSEGVSMIAMEYLDGQPLKAVLQEREFSAYEVANIARQVAWGMAEAHRHGIVHGDLKPANIIVTHDGAAKVTDFGLSRRAKDYSETEETQAWGLANVGKVAGTPRYMSPEQSRGEKVTPASDVFSFGLVLYEMFVREPAFTGENVLQVLSQIRQVDPSHYAEKIPEPFAPILRQALVRHPRERTITMEGIADLLRADV
jgi:serine/threonine protein kinase